MADVLLRVVRRASTCEDCKEPFIYGWAILDKETQKAEVMKNPDNGIYVDGVWAHQSCHFKNGRIDGVQ